MKKISFYLSILILNFTFVSKAQVNLDSLWDLWKNEKKPDTLRLAALKQFTWSKYLFTKPDSAFIFAQMELQFAKKIKNKKWQADAHNTQGISFYFRTQYSLALKSYFTSLQINMENEDKLATAKNYGNIGGIYQILGDYPKALDYGLKALRISEDLKDQLMIMSSLNNLGIVYDLKQDFATGLNYYLKSLELAKKIDDKDGIIAAQSNIVVAYLNLNRYEEAVKYAMNCLESYNESGNTNGKCTAVMNLGIGYINLGNYALAEKYLNECMRFATELDAQETIGISYFLIGSLNLKQSKYKLAVDNCQKSLVYFENSGALPDKRKACDCLYLSYKGMGNTAKALEYHERFTKLQDSIFSEERHKQIIQKEFKFQYEKKAAADSIRNLEGQKVKNAELAKQKAQLKQEQIQRYALYGGLLLVLIFSIFIYNRFRLISQQKKIIENQKLIVEEKQLEVMDSIRYAKRIQQALLPGEKFVARNLDRLKKNK